MWAPSDDRLTQLDTNEGFASRLIGSPQTILNRMREFHELGIECFHLALHDELFNREVLPPTMRRASRRQPFPLFVIPSEAFRCGAEGP